ncbi:DUF6603 domain-containing protein [Chitinophaga sp. Cy-1792]|uniref:DUF6603 domain-containing protein n=1 Tax=Chitinophaga sp. Cy-1792 TaxID=2608339 RepID=UPI0014233ED8|nr:DUF6603 domain-containing protein [Chitinophaga sp. Cy-1792]NIG56675.1 hypothetical protein [Chitinophaga sp. Cy-1792]
MINEYSTAQGKKRVGTDNLSGDNGISFSGLDPVLASLGLLIGLLTKPDPDRDTYSINPGWFANPIDNTQKGITSSPEQFEQLLTAVLGKIGGNALGIPIQDAALLGTWYPIKNGNDPTGFYIVSYQKEDNGVTETVLGLGILHSWKVPPTNAALTVNVWGLMPFVAIGNGSFKITFTSTGYPISLGVAAEGGDKKVPLVDINGISFDGVKFSALIDVAASDPFNVSLEVLSLKLGNAPAANKSLADLLAISGEEILEIATNLFIGALSYVFPNQQQYLNYIPPLLGLSSAVPGLQQLQLPVMEWYKLFEAAANPSKYPDGVKTLFFNWFNALCSDTDALKGWITSFSGFLGNTNLQITGTGTRIDPFRLSIIAVNNIGNLDFCVATTVDDGGIRYFYPGLSFRGNNIRLGSSPAVFTSQADLELGQFGLSAQAVTASPQIKFAFRFALKNATDGQPLVAYDGNSVGTLSAGLILGSDGKIVPDFSLNQVVTGITSFDSVNLLSPGELAEAGAAALSAALATLIGVNDNDFAKSIGALIGLIPPASAKGSWPATLPPPFAGTQMAHSILNPVQAWSDFYLHTLQYTTAIDGKSAFAYLLQEMANLLQQTVTGLNISVTGSGTVDDPWKAAIALSSSTLPAYLTAYTVNNTKDNSLELVMGLSLMPTITIAGVDIKPSLNLQGLSLLFAANGSIQAGWLPEVSANLQLPQGFKTPDVGGAAVNVDLAQLSAGWNRSTGWGWSMLIKAPKLIINGNTIVLGQDLNFNNQTALKDLVKQSASTFSPFLLGALGTLLMRVENRAALFAIGSLGLIPDITKSPVFPTGLSWSGFQQLSLSSLSNPWPDIRNHLSTTFANTANAKSLLSLLSYVINTDITAAPATGGSGSYEDPWTFALPAGFEGLSWFENTGKILGLGAGRSESWSYTLSGTKFNFDLHARAHALKYNLSTGTLVFDGQVPSFTLSGTLYNPDGMLVSLPESLGSVEKIIVGCNLSYDTTTQSFHFLPIVTLLNVTLPGQQKQDQLTLQDFMSPSFPSSLQNGFMLLLNQGLQAAFQQVKNQPLFQKAYSLLSMLGLTLAPDGETDLRFIELYNLPDGLLGINAAGWNGLLANFDTYIQTQFNKLLAVQEERDLLYSFLSDILGFKLPEFQVPVLQLLTGLGICAPAEEGYTVYPYKLLELISNPYQTFQQLFGQLFAVANADNLKQLAANLAKNLGPYKAGRWTFSTDATGVISFGILPADSFPLGSFLLVSGGIQLDLNNQVLKGELDIYCENVGVTLKSGFTLQLQNGSVSPSFTSVAAWGDNSKPSAKALRLIPFHTNDFLDDVADLAPAFSLNILLNAVFEEQLLKKYPLIQQIFEGLGLADQAPTESLAVQRLNSGTAVVALSKTDLLWQMPSLMGILYDPLAWLLSDDVLGTNGKFSVSKLVAMLSHLPEVTAPNGIRLTPAASGMTITGMPYGFEIAMSGKDDVANFGFTTKDLVISESWGTLNLLSFQVGIDGNYQPSFGGELTISSGSKIPASFFVNTGYNKEFFLKISQGTPDSASGLALQLLPFLGWGSLAEQGARLAAAAVLKNLVPTVLQKLSDSGAGDFVKKMLDFSKQVNTTALVDAIIGVLTPNTFAVKAQKDILSDIESVALGWLREKFSTTGAPATVQGLITLLQDVMPGVSAQGGRLAFTPDSKIPVTILAGLNDAGYIGLWADFTLPDTQVLKIKLAETGVGVNTSGAVTFSFGMDLLIPVDDSSGPGLTMTYDLQKGFKLLFDPISNSTDATQHSSLAIELLPNFFGKSAVEAAAMGTSVTDWLLQVVKVVLPRYVSLLILNLDKVKAWLEAPIVANAPTPAVLLEATSLILKTGSKYELNSIDNLLKLTPTAFFGNLLYTLMQTKTTLLQFGTNNSGKIVVGPLTGKANYFGVTVAAPNLKIAALPNLVLQLGADDRDWIDKAGDGNIAGDPGIGFYLPITKNGSDFTVDFRLFSMLLFNLGFDIIGTGGKPIVDQPRFKIGAVQPRTVFSLTFNASGGPTLQFGAGVTLAKIGLSLAPDKLAGSAGTNPIANNILGSGKDSGNPPVNPEFSVSTAYISKLWVNLKSNTGNGSQVIVPIERSFGPLYIDSFGLGWEDQQKLLDFLFTGSVALAGLKASVVGLTVGVPVTDPTNFSKYSADLQGLDISFKGGAVEINGGFVKTTTVVSGQDVIVYNGVAVIKAGTFALMALGSYAEIAVSTAPNASKQPSLFIFAVLTAPLGGPPFFFITGVAAGFSFNRSLKIPDITQVQDFPLLKGLSDGTFADGEDPGTALVALSSVVEPEVGQYWLAAGIKFTSFELLTTSALLFISFGKEFEVNLLGLSFTSLPPKIPRQYALAYFELALKISFKPSYGVLSAEAQLTPNSFVLSKDCKVTGGFAFFLWFKNISTAAGTIPAGDFVISLGGYHPDFKKPAWYPEVPRLGMQWKMDISVGSISIGGGAYFAICPTAVMAGGYLNVAYQLGPLKAWLNASADFLIEWNPFYFNVGISITVGASFGTTILGVSVTLRAELGATLKLEGPPTHGSVKVDWFVISFTIPIGSGKTETTDNNITWQEFADAFLPPAEVPGSTMKNALLKQRNTEPVQQVVKLNPETGLLNDNGDRWTIQPYPFILTAKSAIPASVITVASSDFSKPGVNVGVRPMGYVDNLNAPLTITLRNSKGEVDLTARKIKLIIDQNGAPAAMWSQDPLNRNKPPQSDDLLIPGASYGIILDADEYNFRGDVPAFAISLLKYEFGTKRILPYKNVVKFPPAARYPVSDQNNAYNVIMHSIMTESIISKRNTILQGIAASDIVAPLGPDLSVMASSADMILQALPVIARIGIYQNNGVVEAGRILAPQTRAVTLTPEAAIKTPQLTGMVKRYRTSGGNTAAGVRSHYQQAPNLGSKTRLAATRVNTDIRQLYDGSAVLWSTDSRGTTTLSLTGGLPVRVISFDKHGRLSGIHVSTGAHQLTLAAGTAQVAVQGEEADTTGTIGWDMASQLFKTNTVWALGDGVMVRVQNSQRIRVRGTHANTGLIDAADLVINNRITDTGKTTRNGWIQAVFPAGTRQIAVLVDQHSSADRLDVAIAAGSLPLKGSQLQPVQTSETEKGTLLVYDCPTGDTNAYIAILAIPKDNKVQIKGMYSNSNQVFTADAPLRQAGLDLQAATIQTATVSINTQKQAL